MLSFLPEVTKKEIIMAYRFRVGVVASILLSVVVLFALAMLMPAYHLILVEEEIVQAREKQLSESVVAKQIEAAEKLFSRVSEQAVLLSGFEQASVASDMISRITGLRGGDVAVESIRFEPGDEHNTLILRGVAVYRDALLVFKERLVALDDFNEVVLPIKDLARDRDLEFTITIQGDF